MGSSKACLYNTEGKPSGPQECDGLTLHNALATKNGENDMLSIPSLSESSGATSDLSHRSTYILN